MYKLLRAVLPLIALLIAAPAHAGDGESESAARLSIQRQHTFSREEARTRLQQLLDYWGQAYGVQRKWYGDTARVTGRIMGINFDAKVTVTDHAVQAETTDPGWFLRSVAMDYISAKLRKYLSPNYEES